MIGINSLPNNANSEAVYIVSFTPPILIPSSSIMRIIFPIEYSGFLSTLE